MCKDHNSTKILLNGEGNTITVSNIMENSNINSEDVLKVKKLTGGSLVDHRPVFSRDGEYAFMVCNDVVKCYNAVTSEWVRDYSTKSTSPIIKIELDLLLSSRILICNCDGELSTWQWKNGLQESVKTLNLGTTNPKVLSFNLVYFKNSAIVTWTSDDANGVPSIAVMNYVDNKIMYKFGLNLKPSKICVAVAAKGLNYFAFIQGSRLYIVDFVFNKTTFREHLNQNRDHFTTIVCHPESDTIATGDVKGRIRLWRNVNDAGSVVKVDLYHWHHTPVNSIAFTSSGTMFYSGGSEAVLVKWIENEPDNRSYLPRITAAIAHINVTNDNSKIVVATNDNAIHFYDAQLKLLSMIQHFTWMPNDYTGLNPFPIGLQVNPRTQSIVLNGRAGHLQFFSTHTNSLLYNLDITSQNYQCPEYNKLLFNTRITQCALNVSWMATAEVWDDFQHASEVRLKFWAYNEAKQTFTLNTNVEMPHDKGINKLQFSSTHSVKNLMCVSAGKDKTLKLWMQEDSKNIYHQGKVWMCIAVLTFKDRPINSTSFSSDCSLLAAGFGNTLCIFDTKTFKMKCALTAPNAIDGSANKVQISLNTSQKSPKKQDNLQKRQFYINQIKLLFKSEKHELLKDITHDRRRTVTINQMKKLENQLSSDQNENLFKKLILTPDLSFEQKIDTIHRLGLHYEVSEMVKNDVASYLYKKRSKLKNTFKTVNYGIQKLKREFKFQEMASYTHLKNRGSNSTRLHVPTWFVHFIDSRKPDTKKRIVKNKTDSPKLESGPIEKAPTSIKHVLFGNEDHCHLVCVCTSSRLLIWNLLNLRLQSSFNFSTKFISIDTQTNLIAAFSQENELIIFHINSPLPVYTHKGMTDIYGMTWVPRRYPKAKLSVADWQAASQLYFLNTQQELLYIDTETEGDGSKAKLYLNNLNEQQMNYNTPFASILANNTTSHTKKEFQYWNTNQLGSGPSVVKELKFFQSHTMAPLHLLGNNFILSLSKNSSKPSTSISGGDIKTESSENGDNLIDSSGFDEEEFDDNSQEFLDRKEMLAKLEAVTNNYNHKNNPLNQHHTGNISSKGNFDVSI
uniref:CSON014392 protein n=1 Tax=Culicoides sonorensis TaxID=179676 RepID=A0A336MAF4_CULSO